MALWRHLVHAPRCSRALPARRRNRSPFSRGTGELEMSELKQLVPARSRAVAAPGQALAEYEVEISDSPRRYAVIGWVILLLFFGGLGAWAAIAPLNGAVVSPAIVKVDGNRKTVQHLDGGIVRELRVKEGDHVRAGDVLIVLDDTQSRAEAKIFSEQQLNLRA